MNCAEKKADLDRLTAEQFVYASNFWRSFKNHCSKICLYFRAIFGKNYISDSEIKTVFDSKGSQNILSFEQTCPCGLYAPPPAADQNQLTSRQNFEIIIHYSISFKASKICSLTVNICRLLKIVQCASYIKGGPKKLTNCSSRIFWEKSVKNVNKSVLISFLCPWGTKWVVKVFSQPNKCRDINLLIWRVNNELWR